MDSEQAQPQLPEPMLMALTHNDIAEMLNDFITAGADNTSKVAEVSKEQVVETATTIGLSSAGASFAETDSKGEEHGEPRQAGALAESLEAASFGEAVSEPTIPDAPTFENIDTILENSRIKVLEELVETQQKQLEYFKDKCANLQLDIGRTLEDRNSVKSRVAILKEQIDDLETRLSISNKSYRECHQKLTTARDSLERERRAADAAKDSMEKEQLAADTARDALKDSQRQVSQQSQEIERLKRKSDKLEEMLATEHDRCKEYKLELEHMRSSGQQCSGTQVPMSQHNFMRRPVFASADYPVNPRGCNPAGEYKFDSHYASTEHPAKRAAPAYAHAPAPGGDFRNSLSAGAASHYCKRLCYNGNLCTRTQCNYSHSIAALKVCPYGRECINKARCGHMLHSELEREELYINSRGKLERLCESYEKTKNCSYGEKCYKIHYD